jgi:hypothetical protein
VGSATLKDHVIFILYFQIVLSPFYKVIRRCGHQVEHGLVALVVGNGKDFRWRISSAEHFLQNFYFNSKSLRLQAKSENEYKSIKSTLFNKRKLHKNT